MPERSSNQPLLPSLLDRLTSEPGASRRGVGQSLSKLKQSVALDLQQLLNTRMTWKRCADHHKQLERSLFSYGLPDFSGVAWGDYEARAQLLRLIQTTLELHEPRLRRVRVTFPRDLDDAAQRTLRFRIEAELHVEPMVGPVAFDAEQEASLTRFQVRRADT